MSELLVLVALYFRRQTRDADLPGPLYRSFSWPVGSAALPRLLARDLCFAHSWQGKEETELQTHILYQEYPSREELSFAGEDQVLKGASISAI